jgi:hypothetical protein
MREVGHYKPLIMKKQFAYLIGIGLLNFVFFTGVFKLLHHWRVYSHSMGLISQNYERTGGWENYEIKKCSKPYLELKNENFELWDAGIYKCISERMYRPELDCYGRVRAAFFPLFPILWKITGSTPIGISVINYFLFISSVAILLLLFLKTPLTDKLIIFGILITLPSVIIFYIPYTEALFLFTMTLAVIGIMKKKYGLFFAGILLMSMVRPATLFVLLAMLVAEGFILIRDRDLRSFFKEVCLKSFPFLVGYFCALFIQYLSSGSWTAIFEAQKHWTGGVQLMKGISDWSVEGFGLTTFAMVFTCLPAIGFILFSILKILKPASGSTPPSLKDDGKAYLALISALYLSGIFAFTLITSGGNLHSFFRFTLASPFFYIALLILLDQLFERPVLPPIMIYLALMNALVLFLYVVDYGMPRMQFSFFGLYLFIITGLFLFIRKKIPFPVQVGITLVLIVLGTAWNTYLLNDFCSNGWIFT